MKVKQKTVWIALVVGMILLAISGGVFAWLTLTNNGYSQHIMRAQKSFESADYENAVMEYQKAIKLEPDKEEGYIGLAQTYRAQRQNVMADSTLGIGYERTGSARLELLIGTFSLEDTVQTLEHTEGKERITRGNEALLEKLKTSTYNNYRLREGIVSTEMQGNESCVVCVNGINGKLYFTGESIDLIAGKPAADSLPTVVELDDITTLFGGIGMAVESLRAYGASDISRTTEEGRGEVVTFVMKDCVIHAAISNGMIAAGAWNQIEIPSVKDGMGDGACAVSGKVISATTGNGVSGASLSVRENSQTTGDAILTATADTFGKYVINLDSGSYTVEVSCAGYNTEYFALRVGGGSSMMADNFVISPKLSEGQIRIVLEWGADPEDLDSWLVGNTDSGTNVRVSFQNKVAYDGGNKVAELDVDDTTGYGPETTTIHDINGVYRFAVVDYRSTGRLSQSGATVKIYTYGSSTPQIISVCEGLEYGWAVCEIDHGEVRIINGPQATSAGAVK